MDEVAHAWGRWSILYREVWEKRDKRMDDWPLMSRYFGTLHPRHFLSKSDRLFSSPWPTMLLSATYIYIVKVWGPRFMENRRPFNIRTFLVWYNAAQVLLSTFIFVQVRAGILKTYFDGYRIC